QEHRDRSDAAYDQHDEEARSEKAPELQRVLRTMQIGEDRQKGLVYDRGNEYESEAPLIRSIEYPHLIVAIGLPHKHGVPYPSDGEHDDARQEGWHGEIPQRALLGPSSTPGYRYASEAALSIDGQLAGEPSHGRP